MRTSTPLERVEGALLGCAVGDALGLPCEGLSPAVVAQRFGALERFQLIGRTGFVSDDTEQTALVAEALARAATPDEVVPHFRRALRWWFARLPFGIGLATLRSSLKLWLGLRRSGVDSAGNGAAMRAGLVGLLVDDVAQRHALSDALAAVTHTHPLAVEGARYVADVAGALARGATPAEAVAQGKRSLHQQPLLHAIEQAVRLAAPAPALLGPGATGEAAAGPRPAELLAVGRALGTTGFVLHSVGACTWALLSARDATDGVRLVIRLGGDTDTHAAIVGTWLGAAWGAAAWPTELVSRLHDGPFGPRHLRALAASLATGAPLPRWSATRALLRNLALYPVVLAHGFRRLIPFG